MDDDKSICKSLARLLRASGMTSKSYSSAEEFLTDVNAHFDCLVLDVQLGGISGLELAHQLVISGDSTPFIFITAHDDALARASARAAGCAGYFSKTESSIKILPLIRRLAG